MLQCLKTTRRETSLMILWLRLHPTMQGGAGSVPGRGAKIPHASRPKNQNKIDAVLYQIQ